MCAPAVVAVVWKAAVTAGVSYAANRLLARKPDRPAQTNRNAPPPLKSQKAAGLLKEDQDLRDETLESERSNSQKLARKRKQEGTKTLGAKEAPGAESIGASLSNVPDMGITAPTPTGGLSGGAY